jgi:hypothetical protein
MFHIFINHGYGQQTISTNERHVLFIGNSLTYFYDMPQTLQAMLNETHPFIKVEQSTFPGMSLSSHLSSIITTNTINSVSTRPKETGELSSTEKLIQEKDWDHIILQEGTVAVLIPENRELKVEKAIEQIKKRVTNEDCDFILFLTWPSLKEYPKFYCYSKDLINDDLKNKKYCSPTVNNLDEEMDLIQKSFQKLAKDQGLTLSSNGQLFYRILKDYPELDLYDDTFHPNELGSFLNACIFYQMLTNKNASQLQYTGDIPIKTAKLLKSLAVTYHYK